MSTKIENRQYSILRVPQWLPEWEDVKYDPDRYRDHPPKEFFVTSLPAGLLKALSGVERRTTKGRAQGKQDLGVQRALDPDRSEEIQRFAESGYPWSDLSLAKRRMEKFRDLKMPGWLPTAIVINIKKPGDKREDGNVAAKDLISVSSSGNNFNLNLPQSMLKLPWSPEGSRPIEVIDGQHRLWSFSDDVLHDDFYLPVVAFHGLDISWQAYLFFVINIKPKRINSSLAYDLYPLLRDEDWLQKTEGHLIYRETRAQELTQLLWSFEKSPWHRRINMLGDPGAGQVRQASWVRSLTATLIRQLSEDNQRGGLFGATRLGILLWTRTAQASFLIYFWQLIQNEVKQCDLPWALALRTTDDNSNSDGAFSGELSLLNTDQGVRGVLSVLNDLCIEAQDTLNLQSWNARSAKEEPTHEQITEAISSLSRFDSAAHFLKELATRIATFDWRTASAPGQTEDERTIKLTFRGSGGYSQVRLRLLRHLAEGEEEVARAAKKVLGSES